MKLHKKAIMPQGYRCASKNCGLKDEGRDIAVFYSKVRANAAGVFTKNKFPGASVILGREIMRNGCLRAIIVNSKVSNVGTGPEGIRNAQRMAVAVSKEFNIPENEVIMSSTGVIAKPLPIEKIEQGVQGISKELVDDPLVGAKGMMTTDTYPKAISASSDDATITVIGKGSGMIEPNMATMLVYIFTDAEIETPILDRVLRDSVAESFNMLSVDTDMSTSDTCIAMANGLAGAVDKKRFSDTLQFACIEMTKMLARDGEGATKLLVVNVTGARSNNEAKVIAKALVNSPLVKTMIYGADPNIGRILMAIGKCITCEIIPEKIGVRINNRLVYFNQNREDFDEAEIRNVLRGDHVEISADLNVGSGNATAYGCDLTEGYIKENAAYYSS
jgi:glutamate N-acetyltransferase/amino-acid N-acetyltransferase